MTKVFPGRFTGEVEGDFVVFLIGMRINKPLKVRKWWPILSAMRPMLKAQEANPDIGVLDTRLALLSPREPLIIQIWRSFDQLERFAREDMVHSEPWKTYFKVVGVDSGDVGIWHETFQVRAGEYEAIYGNMPQFGMANAGEHRGLGSASQARERIGAQT